MARSWLRALGFYSLWRVWLIVVTLLAPYFLDLQLRFTAYLFDPLWSIADWIWPWANMDGVVFMLIARSGYEQAQLPFFPLFPASIHLVQQLTHGPYIYSGLLASCIFFLLALWMLAKLLTLEHKSNLFFLVVLLYLSFPTGHYLTAVYNDSLFVLFSLSTLYFGRKHQYHWAGVFGFLAALALLNCLALAFFLGVEYLIQLEPSLQQQPNLKKLGTTFVKALHPQLWWETGIAWALLIPSAFLSYLAWIQWKFGDWYLFFSGVAVWHRDHLIFPLQTLWRYLKMMVTVPMHTPVFWVAFAELFFATFYIVWLLYSWKKIRFSYWVFWAVSWLIPAVTGTFQGMPRYGLHMFPLFLTVALWLENKPKFYQIIWIVAGLTLQVVYVMAYVRGYFVA